ncbi:MAG: carotenoid 1,2-hydratase [Caldilineaceae bacterium]|nr:carotenoid 1,2-hydratase [Caldilineaceae bacterium]
MTLRLSRRYRLFILLIVFLIVFPAGCASPSEAGRVRASVAEAMTGDGDGAFQRATEVRTFTFPLDHGPHNQFRTEWWYYTGNLANEEGDAYGYQLTFFRTALTGEAVQRASDLATNQVYMAHFALTDGRARRHVSFERYARGDSVLAGAAGDPGYRVWLEDWQAVEFEPGMSRLQANALTETGETIALDLLLEQTTEPLFHGNAGLSRKGSAAGNANYYYSIPRLNTSGTITVGERVTTVAGLSWMDHEFGTSALDAGTRGWDWFSLQLDDGTNLMLGELHDGMGENRFVMEGTLALPNGEQRGLGADDFTLQAMGEWTSPRTDITYPSAWTLTLPGQEMELIITPLIPDQEMDISFVYYEGAITVEGVRKGAPVSGQGYVELTGYGDRQLAEYQR